MNDPQTIAALMARRTRHWERVRRLSLLLLILWLGVTVATVFFARDLQDVRIFGWPLSFYLAAQGASLIYLCLIGAYALAMRRLDSLEQHKP